MVQLHMELELIILGLTRPKKKATLLTQTTNDLTHTKNVQKTTRGAAGVYHMSPSPISSPSYIFIKIMNE